MDTFLSSSLIISHHFLLMSPPKSPLNPLSLTPVQWISALSSSLSPHGCPGFHFCFLPVQSTHQQIMKTDAAFPCVCLVAQSCPTLRYHGLYSPWNSPVQNTRVGSLSIPQRIFPTQGSNSGLLYCRWTFTS